MIANQCDDILERFLSLCPSSAAAQISESYLKLGQSHFQSQLPLNYSDFRALWHWFISVRIIPYYTDMCWKRKNETTF
jgi:hypothetical protein